MIDPELRISGGLRQSLEDFRALANPSSPMRTADREWEHASFHTLVELGVQGLERYVGRGTESKGSSLPEEHGVALQSGAPSNGSVPPAEGDRLLAERALALIDASLNRAASTPDYQSSLAAQEGLRHLRGRIHAAMGRLDDGDHRAFLESLAASLCRELGLRAKRRDSGGA